MVPVDIYAHIIIYNIIHELLDFKVGITLASFSGLFIACST